MPPDSLTPGEGHGSPPPVPWPELVSHKACEALMRAGVWLPTWRLTLDAYIEFGNRLIQDGAVAFSVECKAGDEKATTTLTLDNDQVRRHAPIILRRLLVERSRRPSHEDPAPSRGRLMNHRARSRRRSVRPGVRARSRSPGSSRDDDPEPDVARAGRRRL